MSKFISLFFVLALIATTGCKKAQKNAEDYYPEMEMVSATVLSDGRIEVVGTILSKGKHKWAEMDFVGFCATVNNSKPDLDEMQVVGEVVGDQVIAYYPPGYFDENLTYRISAWGTNNYGYHISNPISADSLFLDVTPPCTLNSNYYQAGINTGYYSSVTEVSTNEFWAQNGPIRCAITFPNSPAAGVYTVNSFTAAGKVKLNFYYGGSWYPVTNGKQVYVEKIAATQYKVTVCDGAFVAGSFNTSMATSFNINL